MAGLDPSLSTEGLSLYKELNIEKTSTAAQIKKAYHKQALRCHPDKVGADDLQAAEQFKKINRANKILQNEQTRKIYDKMGSQGIAMMDKMGDQGPEIMEKMMKYDKWYYKALCLILFCGTGCCFGCCCCFVCCCCCCGKCAPKAPTGEDEQELHETGAGSSDDEHPVSAQPRSTDDNNKNTTSQPVFAMPPPESSNPVIAMPPPENTDTPVIAMPPPNYTETDKNQI